MIIWITGLSGAGKTTLGESIYKWLKKKHENTMWFDGDTMREFFDNNKNYDKNSRLKQYKNMINLVNFCYSQKINIIITALYFNPYIFKNNKKMFKNYFQIYLKSNIQNLINRDNKGIYSKNLNKKKPNIVGYDIKWNVPKGSNLVIENFFKLKVNKIRNQIIKKIKKKINKFN